MALSTRFFLLLSSLSSLSSCSPFYSTLFYSLLFYSISILSLFYSISHLSSGVSLSFYIRYILYICPYLYLYILYGHTESEGSSCSPIIGIADSKWQLGIVSSTPGKSIYLSLSSSSILSILSIYLIYLIYLLYPL